MGQESILRLIVAIKTNSFMGDKAMWQITVQITLFTELAVK